MRVDYSGPSYREACDALYQANAGVVDTVERLSSQLSGSGSMAGTDSGGQAWAGQYDPAAAQAVQAGCDLGEGIASMANLTNGSLVNHEGADHGALLGGPPSQSGGNTGDSDPDHSAVTLGVPAPPSANGGTGETPSWWHWLVDHLGGLLWPDADTGRLRDAGQAWTSTGDTLATYASQCESAAAMLGMQRSAEVPDAVAACQEMKGHITDLAAAYREVGTACNDYAQHVDDHHQEIEDELASFIEWTIAIEGAGALLSIVTLGGSEAAAQAAEAAEVANAANKVRRILSALIELARTVATAIGRVLTRIGEISAKVSKFLNAGLEKALVKVGAREAKAIEEVVDVAKSRVKLRVGTKAKVKEDAPKTPDGDYIDPNTDQVIPKEGPFHYGHRPGYEWWRTQRLAREEGWTRREVIEFENNPGHYQIEDPVSNMSHQHEMPR